MPQESETPVPENEAPRKRGGFLKGLLWFFLVAAMVGIGAFFAVGKFLDSKVEETKEALAELVEVFKPEEVVETFDHWRALQAEGNDGNILEVATAESTENFVRESNVTVFGKELPLGTTVSEISVPATYRFHIELSDDWFVTSDGKKLMVLAPKIRPSLPVAFDTAKMQKKTKAGWARWDSAENLGELEKTITGRLKTRAHHEGTLKTVRDASRESVAKFVQNWLLSNEAWGEAKFEEIVVVFAGEEESLSSAVPILEYQESTLDQVAEEVVAP